MDKQLIERIALEVAQAIVFPGFEIDDVMASALTKYANAFLARIDAERGKEAVDAVLLKDMVEGHHTDYGHGLFASYNCVTQLFLSPTIPGGMALVRIDPTDAMIEAGINTPLSSTGDDAIDQPNDYCEVWRSMLAAATQRERDAD